SVFTNTQYRFHFGNGDGREGADVDQKDKEEHTKAAKQGTQVHPRRCPHSPPRRQEVSMQRSDYDYKAFVPHTNIHKDRNNKHRYDACAYLLKPEKLRNNHI